MRYFGHDECLVSESDILDGLAAGLLNEHRGTEPALRSGTEPG